MKRSVITVLVVFVLIGVMSRERYFPRMTEITLAEPVFIIGFDKNGADASKVSIVYEKIEGSDEGDESPNQKYTDSAESTSPAAALEALKKRFPREMATSTADYLLIGEAAAKTKQNLNEHISFLSSDKNLRLTSSVFIVRGEASRTCFILTETKSLDILRNYGEYSGIGAISSQLKLYELLSAAAIKDNNNNAYVIPTLIFSKNEENEEIVVPGGYAIIKNGALAGFIEPDEARGFNIIKNKSVYSVIEIPELNKGVRLENAKREISFIWNNDNNLTEIIIDAEILIDIAEHEEKEKETRDKAEKIILAEVLKIMDISKALKCDFLGIGDILRMKHPLKWERIKDDINEIFWEAEIKVNVKSR